jgi:hypothetical protein
MGVNEATDTAWMQATRANNLGTYDNLVINPYGGNVGIGTTSPSLENGSGLVVYNATAPRISLKNSTTGTTGLDGVDIAMVSSDAYFFNREAGAVILGTSSFERMRIDSSGNLLVGKTSADFGATAGIELRPDGRLATGRAGESVIFNRLSTDGEIALFRKDGTTVGSIGYGGGGILYNAASNYGLKFYDAGGANIIHPATTAGGDLNGSVDLGYAGARFKDLYLSGDIAHKDAGGTARLLYDKSANLLGNEGTNVQAYNVTVANGIYLGGTGAANLLDDYEEGTHAATLNMTSGSVGYGNNVGTYVKVGNQVTYTAWISITSVSSPSGALNITLPFVIPATLTRPATMFLANNMTSVTGNVGGWINPNTATLYLVAVSGGDMTSLIGENLAVSTELYITITYNI